MSGEYNQLNEGNEGNEEIQVKKEKIYCKREKHARLPIHKYKELLVICSSSVLQNIEWRWRVECS